MRHQQYPFPWKPGVHQRLVQVFGKCTAGLRIGHHPVGVCERVDILGGASAPRIVGKKPDLRVFPGGKGPSKRAGFSGIGVEMTEQNLPHTRPPANEPRPAPPLVGDAKHVNIGTGFCDAFGRRPVVRLQALAHKRPRSHAAQPGAAARKNHRSLQIDALPRPQGHFANHVRL